MQDHKGVLGLRIEGKDLNLFLWCIIHFYKDEFINDIDITGRGGGGITNLTQALDK